MQVYQQSLDDVLAQHYIKGISTCMPKDATAMQQPYNLAKYSQLLKNSFKMRGWVHLVTVQFVSSLLP
jgi:hypothetical protein